MGSTCHLKALVTAGTRFGVTKVGLGFLIPIPSHYNFFFRDVEVKQGHEGCRGGFCGKGSHCCRASSSSFRNFPLLLPEMVGFGVFLQGFFPVASCRADYPKAKHSHGAGSSAPLVPSHGLGRNSAEGSGFPAPSFPGEPKGVLLLLPSEQERWLAALCR